MNHRDIAALMAGMAPVVRGYLAKAVQPFIERMDALEKRESPKGEIGEPGKDGNNGAPGRDGADGKDGVDGAAGKDGEQGIPGVDGKDGRDGIDGKDGLPGADGKDGAPGLNGKDGADGLQGKDGPEGKEGAPGRDGRDGLPGAQGEKGVDGKDGRDGIDGKDGFGLDDFDVKSDDDGRTLVFSFQREGRDPIVRSIKTGIILDRGVWTDGPFEKGDGVTWAGSWFVARKDLPVGKPGESDDWRLAVKRGRNGKDGAPGAKGDPGKNGAPGRDGGWQ